MNIGLFLIVLTQLLMVSVNYYIIVYSIYPLVEELTNGILWTYITISFLSWLSHLMCCISDPGGLKLEKSRELYEFLLGSPEGEPLMCVTCGCCKPPRTHHCHFCNKCVLNMDHHCKWINNCVGLYTQKLFLLFLIYTMSASSFGALIIICKIFIAGVSGTEAVFTTLALLVCLITVIILWCVIFDQFYSIKNNTSPIDELQFKTYKKRPLTVNLYEVFGSNWMFWFLPFPPKTYPQKITILN